MTIYRLFNKPKITNVSRISFGASHTILGYKIKKEDQYIEIPLCEIDFIE